MARSKTREVLPLPANLTPTGRVCFCINIPDDPEHFAAFWGAVGALGKRYSWGKPLSDDSDTVADYWMEIIQDNRACFEEILTMANRGCGCNGEPVYRNAADGVQQVSNDQGETWQDSLTDTRNYGSIFPPPLWLIDGGENKCKGAISARINAKFAIDKFLDVVLDQGLALIISDLNAIMCFITAGLACDVASFLFGIARMLIDLGVELIREEMSSAIYERFQCVVFCNIGDDASFSIAQWQSLKDDIQAQFTGDPRLVLWNFVNAAGASGMTALARLSVDVEGNCDSCACACGNPHVGIAGTSFVRRDDLGAGWYQVTCTGSEENPPGYYAEVLLSDCCRFVEYEISEGSEPAPNGNRVAHNCAGYDETGNYGVGQCIDQRILFRAYDAATFTFHLECDEACGGDCE